MHRIKVVLIALAASAVVASPASAAAPSQGCLWRPRSRKVESLRVHRYSFLSRIEFAVYLFTH